MSTEAVEGDHLDLVAGALEEVRDSQGRLVNSEANERHPRGKQGRDVAELLAVPVGEIVDRLDSIVAGAVGDVFA